MEKKAGEIYVYSTDLKRGKDYTVIYRIKKNRKNNYSVDILFTSKSNVEWKTVIKGTNADISARKMTNHRISRFYD